MILAMTLLVRDEADIIRQNIEYHLNNGVDLIIVTDNGSADGTLEICQEYLKKGVVEIIEEPPFDFSQYSYVTRMANLAVTKYNADWIINSDADEFFISRDQPNLKEILSSISTEFSIISIQRHDFVPINEEYQSFLPNEFPYRKTISLNLKGAPLPPKVIHRGAPDAQVAQGNHAVTGTGLDMILENSVIELFHYPIRSYNQFKSKVRNGGSGYSKNRVLNKSMGFHKRHWYELLQQGKLRTEFERLFYDENRLAEALSIDQLTEDSFLSTLSPFRK